MHGKTFEAHAQQQTGHADITRHLAAHRHTLALGRTLGNGVCHQSKHRWVQGVVQVRHAFIGTVNGQRVLNEVVGADRQIVKVL